ncbi:MAG: zf-TFIIB domain-containing protein [Proteobacteria bacterium]|nr:zf-TFIIB domain-containing protein [Pseudomonadota bacterium]MBU4297322.1 zf-TFIIB domain-containing protein [Pseudomonadota bacterium]MCG2747756.1 zf-TFIIB domain-containing protein [Desulfobulbaceae bacterium]
MKCPVCTSVDLLMSDRQGVEIDYCPQCRGVWLDRGELDKIIERSAPAQMPPVPEERNRRPETMKYGDSHHHGDKHDKYHDGKQYKKKSLLKDLFDF